MSYSNEFLRNFRPIFFGILKERGIAPQRVELEVIDEESGQGSMFEPADVRDVLEQLADDLNFLSIYTERPAYFYEFAERMYEENGLVVMLFSKRELAGAHQRTGYERQRSGHTEQRAGHERQRSGHTEQRAGREGQRSGHTEQRAGHTEQRAGREGQRGYNAAGRRMDTWKLLLDFEWEGDCYTGQMGEGRAYIPIHKKPWKQGENLDIMVPIGYNTVIVKGMQKQQEKLGRDRFEEAFYGN
ncbi:MAG: hypothetical protein J6K53_01825 [Roseburia sp.]|nr:hypothetical protein [Roseburia sp.]